MTKTFYQELRTFFMKYDPSRIRLSGKIAATYKVRAHQNEVMKRLKVVYAGGGPNIFFGKDGAIVAKPAKKAIKGAAVVHQEPEVISEVESNNSADDTLTPVAD
jgi:hypothetical protein